MEKREPLENLDSTSFERGRAPLTESQRLTHLDFWAYPENEAQRAEIDCAAQTPNPRGAVLCWRRRKGCNNPECKDSETGRPYRFKAGADAMWNCPLCGKDRHCRKPVLIQTPKAQRHLYKHLQNTGCRLHGGATPSGWDLPQSGTGSYSRVLKVDSLRADYEKMLASPKLVSLTEHIAFLQAHMNTLLSRYPGGASRELLHQMKRNRLDTKAELHRDTPDFKRLRQLQRELDQLIEQGLQSYRIMDDYRRSVSQLARLIKTHDKHLIAEGLGLNADQAKMMFRHYEETFHQGFAMWLDVSQQDADNLAQRMGLKLSAKGRLEFWQELRAMRQQRHDEAKAFVSQHFKDVASSGLF